MAPGPSGNLRSFFRRKVLAFAVPEATVILFGSYARGEPREDSDLDFLIIKPDLKARRKEMVRLRDVLRPLRVPVDIVVASRKAYYEEWSDTPGTLLYKARQEGKIVGSTR